MSAEPRATPVARYVAVLIGAALLSLAVVCGRELWLRNAEASDWESWVHPVVMTVGDATLPTVDAAGGRRGRPRRPGPGVDLRAPPDAHP
ncbi:hypothetical protein QP028_05225 [Corynebacterium suedekumii]|nr:hypothetical protein QP028_05225 [Corynebacterium suedekumii]